MEKASCVRALVSNRRCLDLVPVSATEAPGPLGRQVNPVFLEMKVPTVINFTQVDLGR